MISFGEEEKERGKNTIQFHLKETKRARRTSQEMTKEGQNPFFLCGVEEEGYKEKEEKQREKNGESKQHL